MTSAKAYSLTQVGRDCFSLGFMGVGVFLLAALWMYSALDPSIQTGTYHHEQYDNQTGAFGAACAGFLIYFYGLLAYWVPLVCAHGAFFIWRGLRLSGRFFFFHVGIMMWGCQLLCLLKPEWLIGQIVQPTGGFVGELLLGKLIGTFGSIGGKILMTTGFLVTMRLVFPQFAINKWLTKVFKSTKKSELAASLSPPTSPSPRTAMTFEPLTKSPEIAALPLIPIVPIPQVTKPSDTPDIVKSTPIKENSSVRDLNLKHQAIKDQPKDLGLVFCRSKGLLHPVEKGAALDQLIVETLAHFGVQGAIIGSRSGPVLTTYDFQAKAGTKLSKILGLADDLALALKVESVLMEPLNNESAVGIQIPHNHRRTIYLGDLLGKDGKGDQSDPLVVTLGQNVDGTNVAINLSEMPHLLIAGATGSGKSVGINAILCHLLTRASPKDVKLLLVDPKMLELSVYDGIPHLLAPVITNPQKASLALKWAIEEMESRYELLQQKGVRNLAGYNQKLNLEQKLEQKLEQNNEETPLPYIVIVIDELADLMLAASKDVEVSIQRLAQKARASGIHMILATQRPSVDVITGVIKANLPTRIAYQVVSRHDSRTILDQGGAEKLLGKGDMLMQRPGYKKLLRMQGPFVSDDEVVNFTKQLKASGVAHYDHRVINWINCRAAELRQDPGDLEGKLGDPELLEEAMVIGKEQGHLSASYLQRRLRIGYNKASRLIETLEGNGMISSADGAKPRRWLPQV